MSNLIDALYQKSLDRRELIRAGGVAGMGLVGGALLAGCGGSGTSSSSSASGDAAILNFALNLEYLEAEFYQRAVTGQGMAANFPGSTTGGNGAAGGTVTGGSAVPFSTALYQSFAKEIAADEAEHVLLLRSALGTAAVAEPNIDFASSFGTAAAAAGLSSSFNPFADETSFLLGAFIFEDVGVTAYHGAAGLLSSKATLGTAAGILAVEAYHAGGLRTLLTQIGGSAVSSATAIANLRAKLDGTNSDDIGLIAVDGSQPTTIVDADPNTAVAFARTTSQVLSIVYGNGTRGASSGLFFPSGLNGSIRTV